MTESLATPSLPNFSWIGQLKDDDRELLSSYGEFFPGHPGNIIIEEGAQQTEVVVVISGELEVRAKQLDGTEKLLARVGPGETLGEISLFNPGPATATVLAVEFSQLWRIADSDLIQFMEDNPGAGNLLLRTLASILAQRLRRVDPQAFGISAYAVIDSPELPSPPEPVVAAESPELAPVVEAATVPEARPLPPVSVIKTEPTEPKPPKKKYSTKTQALPDPDNLEPL